MSIYSPMEKRSVFEDFLQGNIVKVIVDGTNPEVRIPEDLVDKEEVALTISYSYHLPFLEITNTGVEAELSFGGSAFRCLLPWDAIYSMETIKGINEGKNFIDIGSMPLRMRERAAASIGLTLEEIDDLSWSNEVGLFEEELDDDGSSDDECIDFTAFLEKKKAKEESE